MIHILVDLYQSAQAPADAYHVAGVADYVSARCAVRAALDRQVDLTLYITDVVAVQWLSDLQHYPTAVVVWRELRPETTFEELFGVPPPSLFTADLLSALALDTLTPPPVGSKVDPISTILAQRLAAIWGYVEPPIGQFERVVLWAAPQRDWNPGRLVELLAYQIRRWTAAEPRFAVLRADALSTDAHHVLIGSALAQYDAKWRRAQPWGTMPEIGLQGVEPLVIETLWPLHTQIAAYWNDRYARSEQASEMLDLALTQMSGLSQAEFDALTWMIEMHPVWVTRDLLTKIERRFFRLPEARDRIAQLRRFIPVPVPTVPEEDWSDARWLRWAATEYIPYFGWVLRASQPRGQQIACAERFADWVYARYPHWLNDDDAPLARRQHSQLRTLLDRDPNAAVFWLVLDGMAWWHSEMLIPICHQKGVFVQEYAPVIAGLPSITRIAKRALVTGMSTTDIDRPTIFAAATAHFAQIRIPAQITYHMSEGLETLRLGEPRCIIVLDNTIDEAAHQRREFTDTLGIRGHLEEIVDALGQAREICARQGRRLHILIGSDHGGTLLPDDARPLPLPHSVKPVEEFWEDESAHADAQKHSPRAAIINDISYLSAEEQTHWYVLERNQFQLERHYLVPRGYDYIKPRPSGWTHGGLTPEELLVPILHLAPELPHIEPLQLTIVGSLRPRQESTITMTLVNVNRFPLEQVTIAVNDREYVHLVQLDAASSESWEFTLPAASTAASELPLAWRIDYASFGVAHVQEGHSIVAIRRLSVDTGGFDDMFGDL